MCECLCGVLWNSHIYKWLCVGSGTVVELTGYGNMRDLDHCNMRKRQMGIIVFFLIIRRPPRSPPLYSSAGSDVYKRQREHRSPNSEQPLEKSSLRTQQNVHRTRTRANRSTFNRSTNIEHNVHLSRPNRTSHTTTSANTTSNTTTNVEQVPKIKTQPKQHLCREQNIEHSISIMRTEHPTQH